MVTLKTRWSVFYNIMVDPWVIVFSIMTIVLIIISHSHISQFATLSTILTIFISICAAILGGRLTKQWLDAVEEKVVVARGKSAVRSLKLLLSTIVSVNKRIDFYLDNKKIEKTDIVELILEEIKEKCNILAEESVSSIENWTDIIPEADVKTHIGIISDMKYEYEQKAKDLAVLQSQLREKENKSKEDVEKLLSAVREKDKELARLLREMNKKETAFGINVEASNLVAYNPVNILVDTNLPSLGLTGNCESEASSNVFREIDKNRLRKEEKNGYSEGNKEYK